MKFGKFAMLIFLSILILLFGNLNCGADTQDNKLVISDIYFTNQVDQWLNIPDIDMI